MVKRHRNIPPAIYNQIRLSERPIPKINTPNRNAVSRLNASVAASAAAVDVDIQEDEVEEDQQRDLNSDDDQTDLSSEMQSGAQTIEFIVPDSMDPLSTISSHGDTFNDTTSTDAVANTGIEDLVEDTSIESSTPNPIDLLSTTAAPQCMMYATHLNILIIFLFSN